MSYENQTVNVEKQNCVRQNGHQNTFEGLMHVNADEMSTVEKSFKSRTMELRSIGGEKICRQQLLTSLKSKQSRSPSLLGFGTRHCQRGKFYYVLLEPLGQLLFNCCLHSA